MGNWFVTRAKDNMDFDVMEDFDVSGEKDKTVLQDCNIRLNGTKAQKEYPQMLRMVRLWDEVNKKELVFITNNRTWTEQPLLGFIKSDGT